MLYLPYCARAVTENSQKAAFTVSSYKERNAPLQNFKVLFKDALKVVLRGKRVLYL